MKHTDQAWAIVFQNRDGKREHVFYTLHSTRLWAIRSHIAYFHGQELNVPRNGLSDLERAYWNSRKSKFGERAVKVNISWQ